MYRSLNPGMIGVTASFEECCRLGKAAGFEGIAVGIGTLEKEGSSRIREVLDRENLKPAVFGLPVEFRQDEKTFEETLADFPNQAALASEVGLSRCSTWVLPGQKDLSDQEYFDLMKRRLGECARILHGFGIRFGLEFIGPKTLRDDLGIVGIGLSTPEKMFELCQALGVPGVGFLLDSWHWYTSHGSKKTLEWMTNEIIVDVHVNDAPSGIPIDRLLDTKRELPGETGVIDLETFFDHLKRVGYDGPVHVEPFNQALNELDDEAAIRKTAEALKRFL